MKPTLLHALIFLSRGEVSSSVELGRALKVSQQTASRWLVDLLKEKLAEKTGKSYVVTAEGQALLLSLFERKIVFTGKVFTGLGEGKYYLSRKGYLKQFKKIGFEPFPGTLNLRLSVAQAGLNSLLRKKHGIKLQGFKESGREFGPAKCFKCKINGFDCAIIVPERAHYDETVLEIVASISLRKKLSLKDGNQVEVEVDD